MSLCRFLPTPSDRMGLLWSLLPLKESIVLEYGPAGTTHYSMGLFGRLGVDLENHLFTTHMSEDDVVMGDTTRLEKAIKELDETYQPKVMFVLASSVSAVIGTDVKGVCSYVQKEVNATLIPLEEGGFKGDYFTGEALANTTIVKHLTKASTQKTEHTFNVLGASVGSYRMDSDVAELSRLMKEEFGFTLHTSLCTNTSVSQIETMSSSTLNLVLSQSGLAAAEFMEKEYGVPYVFGCPYGYQGTLNWLQSVSDVIQKPLSPEILEKLQENINACSRYAMYQRMLKKYKPTVYLYGEYQSVVGLSEFFASMSIPTPYVLSKHSLKTVTNPNEAVVYYEGERERMDILKSLDHTLVFADDISLSLLPENNTSLRFSTPNIKGATLATHLPFMGLRGADFIREALEEYLSTLS